MDSPPISERTELRKEGPTATFVSVNGGIRRLTMTSTTSSIRQVNTPSLIEPNPVWVVVYYTQLPKESKSSDDTLPKAFFFVTERSARMETFCSSVLHCEFCEISQIVKISTSCQPHRVTSGRSVCEDP